jgi:hypothetical protein
MALFKVTFGNGSKKLGQNYLITFLPQVFLTNYLSTLRILWVKAEIDSIHECIVQF